MDISSLAQVFTPQSSVHVFEGDGPTVTYRRLFITTACADTHHSVQFHKSYGLRLKHLAPFALVITPYDGVALIPCVDLSRQFRGFIFRRERFPIEGQVGPANMVVNP